MVNKLCKADPLLNCNNTKKLKYFKDRSTSSYLSSQTASSRKTGTCVSLPCAHYLLQRPGQTWACGKRVVSNVHRREEGTRPTIKVEFYTKNTAGAQRLGFSPSPTCGQCNNRCNMQSISVVQAASSEHQRLCGWMNKRERRVRESFSFGVYMDVISIWNLCADRA